MIENNTFDVVLLLARPAAGKSEIIRFLKQTPVTERKERFHMGAFEEIDDFPMLWTWFEEDDLLEQMGHSRLHSSHDGYFTGDHLWNVLIRRINLEYARKLRDRPDYHSGCTTIVEFSRGSQHGGFRAAFEHLGVELARRAAILYVNVGFAESLRKNRARFNPDRPDSILEHGLSDEKMERLYRDTDWFELTRNHPETLPIQGVEVPYVVFENEYDVTTHPGPALGQRLEDALGRLWERYRDRA